MKEKTKCSGEGGRMSWSISELRGADEENELRREVKSALIGL